MRERYRSSPVRVNGGGEYSSSSSPKHGGERRRRLRTRRGLVEGALGLVVCIMLLVGGVVVVRGRRGGGEVRYARQNVVFKKSAYENGNSAAVVPVALTTIAADVATRRRNKRGSSLRSSTSILDNVETMLASGELTLEKRTSYGRDANEDQTVHEEDEEEEDSGWEVNEVEQLMKTYIFRNAKGQPIELNESQKHQLFVKLRESKGTNKKLNDKLEMLMQHQHSSTTNNGDDTNTLNGKHRDARGPEHMIDGYQALVHSTSDSRLAEARASITLPIVRAEASPAWMAILEDTSVHVKHDNHARAGSIKSTVSRDAFLRRTSALALELLAADDTVMWQWAQETVNDRSNLTQDVRMSVERAAQDDDEDEAALSVSHGLTTGSRVGGLEVVRGDRDIDGDESHSQEEQRRQRQRRRRHRRAKWFGSETANDVLYNTLRREHEDDGQHVHLIDELRGAYKNDKAGFYQKISRLGLLDREMFGTPDYFVKKWQKYISLTPSFDDRIFHGRGIVICGGGLGYIGSLWLSIKMLREQGSLLPIEVFGFGGEQPTPLLRKLFEEQNASFVSMDEIIPGGSTLFKGYVVKIFAILFSSFAEVLSLDSDNMPLVNVDTFFRDASGIGKTSQASEDRYRPARDGALFWPDFWSASVDSDLLLTLGIDPSANEWMGTHDSGQMLIQKRKGWDALMLAAFMSLHADAMYPMLTRNGVGIGDKEVLPICFAALQIPAFKVRRSILPIGFVTTDDMSAGDDTVNAPKMIDCDSDGAGDLVPCKDLIHLRQVESAESRIQDADSDSSEGPTVRKMKRERRNSIFHGTTMAQFSPDERQGIALLHKNCDKWLVRDAIDPDFLNEISWTHFKRFNETSTTMELSDSGGARGSPVTRQRFVDVDAIQPRPPRIQGPGSICEIDVFDSDAQPLRTAIPNVETIERRARLILHEFASSEAFRQYERWRTLRFNEAMETNDATSGDGVASRSMMKDADGAWYKYNQRDDQVEDALDFLENLRIRAAKRADGEGN